MVLISLGAGILAGLLYGLINVRSPAPPAIALVGLLGMLIGEQIVPVAKRLIDGNPVTASWFASECKPRITGIAAEPPAAHDTDGPRQG
ncbi:XapX domain-containing protein [Massilia sp. HP4]|uniref:XapX domain-containing protein n=1 Tax=Massilia sp. HP4 TaxID=2562316 RepID=UPI0010C0D285|nr:XapX domain-containing protein [Massilia sp. HP4]